MKDIVIIGAGVVGTLIARELKKYNLKVALLEKHNDVGCESSSANSAIVHSGYDPLPNTLKAKLNVLGCKEFKKLCEDLDVEYENVGSMTVAFDLDQMKIVEELKKRADANGVPTEILNKEETLKREPNLSDEVVGCLFAPTAGIVDPFNLVAHAAENFVDNGGEIYFEEEVISIEKLDGYYKVKTKVNHEFETKFVINAAGLFSDEIAKMIDKDFEYKITPRKGEYYVLEKNIGVVNSVIFNLPNKFGKGVLVAKTTSNNYIIGPNNVETTSKEDVSTDLESLIDIRTKGVRNLKFDPTGRTIRVFAGNRSHIDNMEDFYIKEAKNNPNFINLIGIESPGLTSAPAIARYVVENFIKNKIDLIENKDFNPKVRPYFHRNKMTFNELESFVKENPLYGQIVCLCETVSLGEILDLLNRSVEINSIRAIKKRLRSGYGKCQGGFCQPLLVKILAEHKNVDLSEILYDQKGSNILVGKAK